MGLNWKDVASMLPAGLDLLHDVVGGPVGLLAEGAGKVIASALGVAANPDDVAAAMKADPGSAEKLAECQLNTQASLQQAAMQQRIALAQEDTKQIESQNASELAAAQAINVTMQKEDDTKKFSWRDAWGYVSAAAFGVVTLLVCYITGQAIYTGHFEILTQIPPIVAAFVTLFGISGLVLGVPQGIESHHAGMVDRINAEKPAPEATPAGGAPMTS